ncbi:MAG TPA: ATP-binding cassette domain-containing protein [Pseudonocardiaceae bacterium]|jgi:peptide/nickel transport system ATP-binding protein
MSLVVEGVTKRYPGRRRGDRVVTAADDVSFTIEPGEAVALVGQSGSGKSTLARMVTGMERQDTGTITFAGTQVDRLRRKELRAYRRRVQMVFQDPYAALNPLHTVRYTLTRPLVNHLGLSERDAHRRVDELLTTVGLTPVAQYADKLPHQLSGGQRQRVVVARALAPEPELLVADEPVSMLDVSLRAGVLDLLAGTGVSLLYITHDLLSARVVADRMLVLHQGRIVEHGPTVDVLRNPRDEYTRALLDALPTPFAQR